MPEFVSIVLIILVTLLAWRDRLQLEQLLLDPFDRMLLELGLG